MSPRRLLAAAALAALVLAAPARAQAPPAGKKFALLVGVNEYQNRKLAPLRYAEADVTELAKVLKDAGFEVRLLTGSAAGNDEATRANIEAAFAGVLKGAGRRDTLLLAFAGHGQQLARKADGEAEKEVPFFCPKDAVPSDPATLISLSGVVKTLDERGGGTNLVLVDACRNVVDPNRGARGGIDGNRVEGLGEGTAVFFACSGRQRALETDRAGGGHGVFFHFVLEGLRGAAGAVNGDGDVTWDRLVPFVKERVGRQVPAWFPELPAEERQRPHAIGNLAADPVLVNASAALIAADSKAVDELILRGNGTDGFYKANAPARVDLWRRAAEAGNPAAMVLYGRCLQDGRGVGKDEKAAVGWYRRAAGAGNALAMNNLGLCYQSGEGVGKDPREAVAWYRKAADLGEPTAMNNLGVCYENGEGVARDARQAAHWYRKAYHRARETGNKYIEKKAQEDLARLGEVP